MEILQVADVDTPLGSIRVVSGDAGLVYVELPHANGRGLAGFIQRHARGAGLEEAWAPNRDAARQIVEYLEGKRCEFDLAFDLRATPFQREVYDRIAAIGYGQTRTYAEVAAELGRPQATRAVGAASGANPLPLVVPCHRVVAKGGHLQGYAGGVELKRRLLAMETRSRPGQGRLL